MTISEGMVLAKTIRERINSLIQLRNLNAVERKTFYLRDTGENKQREEVVPKYDPKLLDQRIVALETTLFKIDTAIKRANATTNIGVEFNIDEILAPIQ